MFQLVLSSLFSVLAAGSPTGPGPHGGFLQSSNDFHAELVLKKQGALVYLMNKQDQNPLNEQASVYFLLKSGRFEANYYCGPVSHHFECKIPHPLSRKPGDEITIKAVRKGLTDHFHYTFPLESAAPSKPAH